MSEFIMLVGDGAVQAAERFPGFEGGRSSGGSATVPTNHGVETGSVWAIGRTRPAFSEADVSVFRTPDLVVAARGSLYYRDDLVRRLGLPIADHFGPAEMIAAAWLKWKEDCVRRLEGDWTFALFDLRNREAVCARNPYGIRTLFHATTPFGFGVSSSPGLILSLDRARFTLSRTGVIRVLSDRDGDGSATVWSGLHELPAGHLLCRRWNGSVRRAPFWAIAHDPAAAALTADDAVRQTRDLLASACRERVPGSGAAVAMSGGWDSTAIAGSLVLNADSALRDRVGVVTLGFPEGDPGNEDAFVRSVLDHLELGARWIDTGKVPVAGPHFEASLSHALPNLHHFHGINRALAGGAAEGGYRTLLSGAGGDVLFDVDPRYMSELAMTGRWLELGREWRGRGLSGWGTFREVVLRPSVPDRLFDLKAKLQGRTRAGHPLRPVRPPWLTDAAWQDERVLAEDRVTLRGMLRDARDRFGRSVTSELRWLGVAHPVLHRVASTLANVTSEVGVTLRIPYLDDRLVGFALSRPRHDHVRAGESKILLRRSMEGVLPSEVLASRSRRTGTTDAYFRRGLAAEVGALRERVDAEGSRLAEMGLIDLDQLRTAVARLESDRTAPELALFRTLHLDLWLGSC